MRKILLALTLFLIGTSAQASYVFRNSASNINTGILPNARLDPSSVTLQGNNLTISTVASGVDAVSKATDSLRTTFFAYTSTNDAQQNTFINFRSTGDTSLTNFVNFRSTTDSTITNLSASTFSVNTPFGFAPIIVGTVTVFGSTNPYRTVSIPAAAWFGMGVASASWTNAGFPISSGTVAGLPYNRIGRTFHEFRTPSVSTSIAYVEFRMPFEWDGSSVGVQIDWYAASGTANTNTLWSVGGIAISSGSNSFAVFTTSTSVQSTYKAANQEALSPLSAGFSIEGSPVPGSKIVFFIMASGGGFDGLPHATELLVSYRQAVWDGKPR